MANINSGPSQVATSASESIPFESIIGAPLDACIKAQALAAQTSANFIKNVGMQDRNGDGVQEAINVSFTFIQNGKMARLNIPQTRSSVRKHQVEEDMVGGPDSADVEWV